MTVCVLYIIILFHTITVHFHSELNDSQVRERFIYSYRLIYEIKDNDIHIMGLIQGKRLLESVKRFDTDYTLAAVTVALPEQPVRHLTLNVSFILPSCTYRS